VDCRACPARADREDPPLGRPHEPCDRGCTGCVGSCHARQHVTQAECNCARGSRSGPEAYDRPPLPTRLRGRRKITRRAAYLARRERVQLPVKRYPEIARWYSPRCRRGAVRSKRRMRQWLHGTPRTANSRAHDAEAGHRAVPRKTYRAAIRFFCVLRECPHLERTLHRRCEMPEGSPYPRG
jgi:hypothetical protein